MIAYNNEWLRNLSVRDEATELYHNDCLTKTELNLIETRFPVFFYTPNFFIRIGLFILTAIVLSFSFGLFALLFLDGMDRLIGAMAIFFGTVAYIGLEYMVKNKNHYRSGADDALLWTAAMLFFGGISYSVNAGPIAYYFITTIISGYFVVRFTNRIMAAVAYFSLLGTFFYIAIRLGVYGKILAPFILMGLSAIIYLIAARLKKSKSFILYESCLQVTRICALTGLYLSVNYFIVRELTNAMFDLNLPPDQGIPYGWAFWVFTCLIPLLYLARGIQKKDLLLIRVGLVLVAAIIFTIKSYYFIASIGVIMTLGGIVLAALAYVILKYLKTPRHV